MSPTAWSFILFGILGIVGEVAFTALSGLIKTRQLRLQGMSYLWMFPIYGLLAFLFPPVARGVADFPWVVRGVIYMLGFFAVEYVTGSLLTLLTGSHIWNYQDRWNIKGQVTLTYIPVWFVLGLLVERYAPWAERAAAALAGLPQ